MAKHVFLVLLVNTCLRGFTYSSAFHAQQTSLTARVPLQARNVSGPLISVEQLTRLSCIDASSKDANTCYGSGTSTELGVTVCFSSVALGGFDSSDWLSAPELAYIYKRCTNSIIGTTFQMQLLLACSPRAVWKARRDAILKFEKRAWARARNRGNILKLLGSNLVPPGDSTTNVIRSKPLGDGLGFVFSPCAMSFPCTLSERVFNRMLTSVSVKTTTLSRRTAGQRISASHLCAGRRVLATLIHKTKGPGITTETKICSSDDVSSVLISKYNRETSLVVIRGPYESIWWNFRGRSI